MGRGRPRFEPTPEQRSMVESMKGYGMQHACAIWSRVSECREAEGREYVGQGHAVALGGEGGVAPHRLRVPR
jgi:hypothetical protein